VTAPAAKSRRYRQDGVALTDGFTVRLPVGVDGDARRIARVLGVTLGDFATRALAEAVSMAMADPDVRAAVQAMARLDARGERAHGPSDRTDREEQEGASGDPPPPAPEAPAHAAVGEAPNAAGGGPGTVPGSGPRAPRVSLEERRQIGSRLRAARVARRMTQPEVGAELGCPFQVVSMIECADPSGAGRARLDATVAWIEAPHPRDPDREPGPARAAAAPETPPGDRERTARGREPAPPSKAHTTAPAPTSPSKRRDGPSRRRGPEQAVSPEERRRIAAIVRETRRRRHLTQQQVAHEIGTSMQAVSAIERATVCTGAGAERVLQALAWAEAPHRLDDPAAREAADNGPSRLHSPVPRLGAPRIRERETDWRPREPATPMVLPKGLELLPCPALRARITERQCATNAARFRSGSEADKVMFGGCEGCAGVVALAKKRPSAA